MVFSMPVIFVPVPGFMLAIWRKTMNEFTHVI